MYVTYFPWYIVNSSPLVFNISTVNYIRTYLIFTLCLQETVGVEWRGRSLLFVDEEFDNYHIIF